MAKLLNRNGMVPYCLFFCDIGSPLINQCSQRSIGIGAGDPDPFCRLISTQCPLRQKKKIYPRFLPGEPKIHEQLYMIHLHLPAPRLLKIIQLKSLSSIVWYYYNSVPDICQPSYYKKIIICHKEASRKEQLPVTNPSPSFYKLEYPINAVSTSFAQSRPSRIAHTTRDCPLCISPAVKIFSTLV